MQTIKTAVVVVLLLAVLYGVYVALNTSEPELPPGLPDILPGETDFVNIDTGTPIEANDGLPLGSSTSISTNSSGSPVPPPLAPKTSESADSIATAPGASSGNRASEKTPSSSADLSSSKESGASTPIAPPLIPSFPSPANTNTETKSAASSPPSSNAATGLASLPPTGATSSIPSASPASSGSPKLSTLPPLPKAEPAPSNSDSGNTASASSPSSIPPGLGVGFDGAKSGSAASGDGLAGSGLPSRLAALPKDSYVNTRKLAVSLAEKGKLKDSLVALSAYYGSPELTVSEANDQKDMLDALAAEVIYSKRHLVEPPYRVGTDDTLQKIADRFHVTPDLLARVNGLDKPEALLPSSELKVLKGPFNAEISLVKAELTLFVAGMYAGRFPISVGSDPAPKEGEFQVTGKQTDRPYYSSRFPTFPAGDPRNPYGRHFIDLGQGFSIHGSAEREDLSLADAGCISLSYRDAEDVYLMLSSESKVEIVK